MSGVLSKYNTYTKTNKIYLWLVAFVNVYSSPQEVFFRIECSPIITALIFIISLENATEQATPISISKSCVLEFLDLEFDTHC